MKKFTIEANNFLSQNIQGYFRQYYIGGENRHLNPKNIEHLICSFKNDITVTPNEVMECCIDRLSDILREDLCAIVENENLSCPTICVIPRAKVSYRPDQMLFKATIKNVVQSMSCVVDGTDYIIRTADTKTTHRARRGYGGDGKLPYPGITIDTCAISNDVRGKDIILIDDLYTKTVNIDEDAIEALLRKGANSVTFYSIGRTVSRY
ncbi:MAG: phosphoribosyltransferase [Tidjanibacter sp.]|nr:phosphoribosyltransferase [Tidjanibacter sp.]